MRGMRLTGCDKCAIQTESPPVMVTARECNYSAFNGYHRTPSAYSQVRCIWCQSTWRTKAKHVDHKPDAPDGWANMSPAEWRRKLKVEL